MVRFYFGCILLLSFWTGYSQEPAFSIDTTKVKIDSLYREDQFYAGINYNSLVIKPEGVSQQKISFGFSAGFLRDMPINKSRTFAIAPGIGLSFNNYLQNMAITGSNHEPIYQVIPEDVDYKRNRFEQLRLDLPLEIRWRRSSPQEFQFFRLYTGFKASYLLYDKSVYEIGSDKHTIINNKDFEDFLYGVYLSVGYSAFNLQLYYNLNSFFSSSAKIDSTPITMNTLSIGVIYYIL